MISPARLFFRRALHPRAHTTFWLGAHKTGTTFLQKTLWESRAALAAHGVGYEELEAGRNRFIRPLLSPDSFVGPLAPGSLFTHGAKQTLVFDENIIGLVQQALSTERLYPLAIDRLNRFVAHTGLEPDEIVFGIRSFDGYLPSLYCETLKATPFKPFHRFIRRLPAEPSWTELIQRLQTRFPRAQMRVYQYEALRGNETQLLSRVLPLAPDEFTLHQSDERPGFSQAAIDRLEKLHKKGEVTRPMVSRAVRNNPKGPDNPAYYPWKPKRAAALRALYARDIAKLQRMAHVRMIEL